jgi:hypothetical protein
MNKARKVQLENAGDEATFTITTCRTVETKFGERMVFAGTDVAGEAVETPLMPEATATKQLDRLGLTHETCIGETLRFSRAANPSGKPYWNIDVAGAAPAPTKRLPAPTPSVSVVMPTKGSARQMAQSYANLWEEMAGWLEMSCYAHKMTLTAEAVQAATATVWIALRDHGLQGVTDAPAAPKAEPAPAIKHPAPTGKRLSAPDAPPDYSKVPPPSDSDYFDDSSLPF